MKNNTVVTRLICGVILAALCIVTLGGAYLGIMGRNTEYATIHTEEGDVRQALYRQVAFIPNTINETWREAIRPSADLGGGYSYLLTAETPDAGTAKSLARILKNRAVLLSGNAISDIRDDGISVTVPETQYNSLLATILNQTGEITFAPYDSATGAPGDTALTKEHVQQAYYYTSDNTTFQVQVRFNANGRKVIDSLIKDSGVSILYLIADGQAAAYAALSTMKNGVVAFSLNSASDAMTLVDLMRSGALPAAVTYGGASAAGATRGGLVTAAILFCAALTVCAAVVLILRSGTAGLTGVWAAILWIVCFCLSTSLISVNASWIMTLPSMCILVLCLCGFLAGLCILFIPMGRMIKKGRGALAACKDLSRAQLKGQAIVCAAVLLAGLVLMVIFRTGIYGVLGRILAMGALISFAMLQVFPRLVFSCTASLSGRK